MIYLNPENDEKFLVKKNTLHQNLLIPEVLPLGNMSICMVDDGYLLAIRQFNYFFKDDYAYEFINGDFFFGRNYFFVLVDKEFNYKKTIKIVNRTNLDIKLLEDVKLTKQGNIITICGTYVSNKKIQIVVFSCIFNGITLTTTKNYYLSSWNYTDFQKNWMMLPDENLSFLKDVKDNELVLFNLIDKEISISRFGIKKSSGSAALSIYKNFYIALVHRRNKFMYNFNLICFDRQWNCRFFSDDFKFTKTPVEFSCGFVMDKDDFVIPVTENDATTTFFKVKFEHLLKKLNIKL